MIKNEFKLAFFRKMSEQNLFQICNFYYDESLKLNMKSNFIELPKSYDLKEISIAKDQEIIVLLQEKHFMKSNEKAHCLLGSLNLSQIKKGFEIPLSEGQTLKDDMQVNFF